MENLGGPLSSFRVPKFLIYQWMTLTSRQLRGSCRVSAHQVRTECRRKGVLHWASDPPLSFCMLEPRPISASRSGPKSTEIWCFHAHLLLSLRSSQSRPNATCRMILAEIFAASTMTHSMVYQARCSRQQSVARDGK